MDILVLIGAGENRRSVAHAPRKMGDDAVGAAAARRNWSGGGFLARGRSAAQAGCPWSGAASVASPPRPGGAARLLRFWA